MPRTSIPAAGEAMPAVRNTSIDRRSLLIGLAAASMMADPTVSAAEPVAPLPLEVRFRNAIAELEAVFREMYGDDFPRIEVDEYVGDDRAYLHFWARSPRQRS